ncbi:hypothetical protein GCM10023171_34010 [Microbacterium panaciterrae]|uniref:Uncharacterized protein n=1 Tax=Microbacterium panaciterrae TaxID=985759 RepID=A0ABP8PTA6_9MICO
MGAHLPAQPRFASLLIPDHVARIPEFAGVLDGAVRLADQVTIAPEEVDTILFAFRAEGDLKLWKFETAELHDSEAERLQHALGDAGRAIQHPAGPSPIPGREA